ncbi:hypothetical protein V1520DRAFT_345716, partial [Lipomyces starkeyi]
CVQRDYQSQQHTFIPIDIHRFAEMSSQASDMLSQFDGELLEVLGSPIAQGPSSFSSYVDGYNYKAQTLF